MSITLVFLLCSFALSFYDIAASRRELQALSAQQQQAAVALQAERLNEALEDRFKALHLVAAEAGLGRPGDWQALLGQRPVLQGFFNGGVTLLGADGTARAGEPRLTRPGISHGQDAGSIAVALQQGQSTVGRPFTRSAPGATLFAMTVPVRAADGQIIGALQGATRLDQANFVSKIINNRYGESGGYLLVAPLHRLIVTATDQRLAMTELSGSAVDPLIHRFMAGYQGSGVLVNPAGARVLATARGIAAAGWYIAAELPLQEADAPVRAMQRRMLMVTLFYALLAGGLTWLLFRLTVLPMLTTVKTLSLLADSGQTLQPLPVDRQDEIGQLVSSFNHLIAKLANREARLAESDAFKHGILNSMVAQIAVLDHAGVILMVNDAWQRFAPASSGQPAPGAGVGANYLDACQPMAGADPDQVWQAGTGIRAVLAGQQASFALEYACHSAQQQRWFNMSVTPLGAAGPGAAVLVHTDISQRMRDQQALLAARDEAERANQAKSRFLTSMSHELRTPLNAILGYAQVMDYDSSLPTDNKEHVGAILAAGDHLLQLIKELLDLARVESGQAVITLEVVDVDSVVRECLRQFAVLADSHRIAVGAGGVSWDIEASER